MKMTSLRKGQACLAMVCGLVALIGSIPTSMAQTIYGFNEGVLSVFDPATGIVTPPRSALNEFRPACRLTTARAVTSMDCVQLHSGPTIR